MNKKKDILLLMVSDFSILSFCFFVFQFHILIRVFYVTILLIYIWIYRDISLSYNLIFDLSMSLDLWYVSLNIYDWFYY
jgi:hypothetical protein